MDGGEADAPELEVPGVAGAFMKVMAVSPSDGAVALRLRGISKDRAKEFQAATRENLSIELTHKPLINLVWGGFYVLMAGGLMALVKRTREARRAVVPAAESSREAAVAATIVAATPAATLPTEA